MHVSVGDRLFKQDSHTATGCVNQALALFSVPTHNAFVNPRRAGSFTTRFANFNQEI